MTALHARRTAARTMCMLFYFVQATAKMRGFFQRASALSVALQILCVAQVHSQGGELGYLGGVKRIISIMAVCSSRWYAEGKSTAYAAAAYTMPPPLGTATSI